MGEQSVTGGGSEAWGNSIRCGLQHCLKRDSTMFYDRAKIWIKAGNGGNGSASFRREKFIPKGGPDGGDGGRGGSVYLRVNPDLNTLLPFHYKQHFKAEHGGAGGSNKRHGKAGKDM